MWNNITKIWLHTGKILCLTTALPNLCSLEPQPASKSMNSFSLGSTPKRTLSSYNIKFQCTSYIKNVFNRQKSCPMSYWRNICNYQQMHTGSWTVQYLPWIISPSSLFWQYKRNASSSSIWDEMVHGSPEKKHSAGKLMTEELSREFQLGRNTSASTIALLASIWYKAGILIKAKIYQHWVFFPLLLLWKLCS